MLAVDQSLNELPTSRLPTSYLIHQSMISTHHSKRGYDYPTIRLPHTFSQLAGLPTRICQTIHDGALAFLVVISRSDSASKNGAEITKSPALTWRRSPVRIRPSPSFFLQSDTLQTSIGPLSEARIVAKKRHNEDKKLHNSEEKLHNSNISNVEGLGLT